MFEAKFILTNVITGDNFEFTDDFVDVDLISSPNWFLGGEDLSVRLSNPNRSKPALQIELDPEQYINDSCFTPRIFTGLHDAAGDEIYEGDVLKFDDILADQLFLARFVDGSYVLWPSDELGCPDLLFGNEPIIKIIGNRYQPEFKGVFGDV